MSNAFSGLKELRTIYFPHSLEIIEMFESVADSTSLTDIYYNGTNRLVRFKRR